MGFMSYNTSQHCCYVSDPLASPLQNLHKSFAFSSRFSGNQDAARDTSPLSMGQLSKWKVTSISEWQSGCTKLPPSLKKTAAIPPFQQGIFGIPDLRNSASACRCSATNLCGPYLVVELSRACGCFQSVQVRVNAYSERFVFLDGVTVSFPADGAFSSGDADSSSEDDSSVEWPSNPSTHRLSKSDNLPSTFFLSPTSDPDTSPSEDFFIKYFQFPLMSKRFSLVDLALLLNAVQQEHADHRWTDSYADRSLIEFTSTELFAFLDYFLDLDWRNQVFEHRRSIAKRFYDKRVMAWNTWIPSPSSKLIGDHGDSLSSPKFPPPQLVLGPDPGDRGSQNQAQDLDHERRLLSCMKDRVSFVNDELRLLWMALAAQKCALEASKMYLDEGER